MNMAIALAALSVILVWSTTALAVQWSIEHIGFLFAASVRMLLGGAIFVLLLRALSQPLPRDTQALRVYIWVGFGMFCSLGATYWAAQYLYSGMLALAWGLLPLFTGLVAALILRERFGVIEISGVLLALLGLWRIGVHGQVFGAAGLLALAVLMLAMALQAFSTIQSKRHGHALSPFAATAGGLLVAGVLFVICWLMFDRHWPVAVSTRSLLAMVYLAVIGNVLGMGAYFYLLHRVAAGRAALVTLVTPVLALVLGHVLNGENWPAQLYLGMGLIAAGMLVYQRPWRMLRAWA